MALIDKLKNVIGRSPTEYRCENCDIQFESKLDVGMARCPDCGSANEVILAGLD